MIYVYCPRKSDGARLLCQEGGFKRLTTMEGVKPKSGLLVNWGAHIPSQYVEWYGKKYILNPKTYHNKYNELVALQEKKIPVVPFALKPGDEGEWLARDAHHKEAKDLLKGLKRGDYYVGFVPTTREFRVHIFNGKSARAGIKVPRVDSPHPRFRSWTGGWKLDYGTACQDAITPGVRSAAAGAIEALGYNFGAVDVGVKTNGKAVVFEVNAAPGLEGVTIQTYVKKIKEIYEHGSYAST